MLNQIVNFSHSMVTISSLFFSLNAKYTLYFFNNFKNTPKASEHTSLVINYVLSGNLIVLVLDHCIFAVAGGLLHWWCVGVISRSVTGVTWEQRPKLQSTILTVPRVLMTYCVCILATCTIIALYLKLLGLL